MGVVGSALPKAAEQLGPCRPKGASSVAPMVVEAGPSRRLRFSWNPISRRLTISDATMALGSALVEAAE